MKYSNVDLFEKRMIEKEKEKEKFNSTLMSRHIKSFSSSINKSKLNFDLTFSTLPSTKRTFFSNGRKNKRIKKIKEINYNSDILNNNNLYLTQTPLFEDKTIFTSKSNKKIKFTCLSNNENYMTMNNNDKKSNNNKLLYLFEKEKILPNLKNTKKKKNIEIKIGLFNNKRQKVRDYINKTRDVQLLKYTTTIQKERNIRVREQYDNEIERVDEAIKTINESSKLFNDKFINKFNDAVKQLFTRREIERTRNIQLIEQILQYKNEISLLESKIRKVEFDKYNIIRWIYFQICVNEKILNIPAYYKAIIEESEENFKKNIYGETKEKTGELSLFNNNIIQSNNTPNRDFNKNYFKRDTLKKLFTRSDTKKYKKDNNFTERLSTIKTYVFGSIYKNLPKNEIERIRQYRNSITFSNVDDFLSQFKQFENKNLNYIYQYNDIKEELLQLHKEKQLMILEWKKEMDYTLKLIEIKENELKDIKNKNEMLLEQLKIISKNTKTNFKNKKEPKNKVYLSIVSLFKKFSQIDFNYYEETLKNKKFFTEEEILYILKKIEYQIDYLDNRFKVYKEKNEEQLKALIINVEKQHKVEKTKKQREEEEDKIEKLKEKLEQKKNKIYLIPRKKIEKYFGFQNKKNKNVNLDESVSKEPSFDDYI